MQEKRGTTLNHRISTIMAFYVCKLDDSNGLENVQLGQRIVSLLFDWDL